MSLPARHLWAFKARDGLLFIVDSSDMEFFVGVMIDKVSFQTKGGLGHLFLRRQLKQHREGVWHNTRQQWPNFRILGGPIQPSRLWKI